MYAHASGEGLGEEIEFLLPCAYDQYEVCNKQERLITNKIIDFFLTTLYLLLPKLKNCLLQIYLQKMVYRDEIYLMYMNGCKALFLLFHPMTYSFTYDLIDLDFPKIEF